MANLYLLKGMDSHLHDGRWPNYPRSFIHVLLNTIA